MPLHVTDSPDAFATAVQIAPTVTAYPFASAPVPDTAARTHTRTYRQAIAAHAPATATRTSHTNLLLQSATLATTPWNVYATTTANAIVANPWDGTVTAARILETSATDVHIVGQNYTYTAGTYTATIIVRGLDRPSCRLLIYDGTSFFTTDLTFSTGATAPSAGATTTATKLNDSWWLLTLTATVASGAGYVYIYPATAAGTVSYAGDTAKGLYVAHAQLETGSTPGPLIITTTATRTVSSPATDASDPFAYLVEESEPTPSPLGRTLTFTRTYARLPADQVVPTTTLFERPNLHDLKSGSTYAVSFDDGVTSALFSSRLSASIGAIVQPTTTVDFAALEDPDLPAFSASVTGSTAGGSNFSNASSASTIQSAFTARGATFCSVTKTDKAINITYDSANIYTVGMTGNAIIEGSAGSITIKSPVRTPATTAAQTQNPNTAQLTRVISSTAHGGAAGARLVAWNGDTIVGLTKVVSVATDTLVIPADEGPFAVGNLAITHIQFEANAAYHIYNGPIRCSAKRTTKFYLPGVSGGITTADDIVPPAVVTGPEAWLAQAVAYLASPANNTFAVHEVADLTPWRGPILAQEILSLQLADAIRSV